MMVFRALPFFSAFFLASSLFFSLFRPLGVRGRSMEPVFSDGDVVFARYSYLAAFPRRGDVWIFRDPLTSQLVIKRCLLVAGDPIKIVGKRLITPQGDLILSEELSSDLGSYQAVPQGWVFMVGDNWRRSLDSRVYGLVSVDNLRGRVLFRGSHAR